jgi:hypothetical protein
MQHATVWQPARMPQGMNPVALVVSFMMTSTETGVFHI